VARKARASRPPKLRALDLRVKIRAQSIVSLEWGCAYAFPVPAAQAIPLIVVSELYRSPKTQEQQQPRS
jgi:hypothetical protein